MNSAYTDLEASIVARELGAKQDAFPQVGWWRDRGTEDWAPLPHYMETDRSLDPNLFEYVTALPWFTDDTSEQSALGLLESFGVSITYLKGKWGASWDTRGGRGVANFRDPFDSLRDLFLAYYEMWKSKQKVATA